MHLRHRSLVKKENENNNEIINLEPSPEINLFIEKKYNKDENYKKETLEEKKNNKDKKYEMKTLGDKLKHGYMYELPKINERLILVDTEVTGDKDYDRII